MPERSGDQERLRGRGRLPRQRRRSIATATASPTTSTSAPTIPRTRTASRTRTAAPIPTTTRTASSTSTTSVPNDPEDKDGFEDEDGCPDPDNDKDRILDKDDKCPNEPETYNGFEDEDGCPDKGSVIVRKGKLEILDKIYFETDKAIIKPISFPILDAIAATLKGNPQIELIEIQGHADERGDDDYNLDLTERRAHSVRVPARAAPSSRAACKRHGYGETKPVCPQHNEDCWSKNRRVEFVILKRSDEAKLQGGEGQ